MNFATLKSTAAAIAVSAALLSTTAYATGEAWDQNWTPDNGFGGLSRTWGLADAGSAYAAWNVFNPSSPAVLYDSTPDAGSFGLFHAFVYEQTGGASGAFVTGGGNIYSFSAPTSFQSYIQGTDLSGTGVRDVVLRLETLGNPLATSSVLLDGTAPTTQARFDTPYGGSFGGTETEWVFVWKNVANVGPYTFTFDASESSMSLSQAAMYYSPLAAVPEPHEWALMAAGLGLVGVVARRRRSASSQG